jgi:POT family proton-dependent oligopeptide transporter
MNAAVDDFGARMRPRPGDLMGHPRGLAYLVGVEGFWAFAFFGFQGLLTLYMTRHILVPGHVEHVIGFPLYRHLLEGGGPALPAVDIASQTYGWMSSLSYALPLLGAVVADRWLGTRRSMMVGLTLMATAMAIMVTEAGFLVGLCLMILGNGLTKCNLMVSISRLYSPDDPRRTSAFAIYLIFANIGAFSWPLIAGTLAEKVNFPVGIAALAIGMILALATCLAGRAHTPAGAPVTKVAGASAAARPAGQIRIALILMAAMIPGVLFFGAYQQSFNIFPVWASAHVNRHVLGFEVPVTWFSTLDGLLTIAGAMLTIRLWDRQIARGRPMGDLRRMAVGAAMGVAGFGFLAAAALVGGQAPIALAVGYFVLLDPAITWVDTVTLALVSRTAPAAINSTMVGVYGLSMAASYFITGQLGRLYAHLTPAAFWATHIGVEAAAVLFLAVAGPSIARGLAATRSEVLAAEAGPQSAPALP